MPVAGHALRFRLTHHSDTHDGCAMDGTRDPLQQMGWQYDIREIPEDLYLAVLALRKQQDAGAATDLGG